MKRCITLLAACLLAACASRPPAALPDRPAIDEFDLEARFALRVTPPGQPSQSSTGRLTWEHRRESDRILLANPLGYGIAEIESSPTQCRLKTADGKIRESSDPDALMEEVTGQRLPVRQMPAWLLGRASGGGQISDDARQRPSNLREAGWSIDYAYDDDAPGTPPARLTLKRGDEIELRLRIEEWKAVP